MIQLVKRSRYLAIGMGLVALLVLTACGGEVTATTTPTDVPPPTLMPTPTPEPTATSITDPTPTPVPTPTPESTSAPMPTPTPTATTPETVQLIPRQVLIGNPDKALAQLSPDGTRISYLAPLDGVLNVWVGPADEPVAAKPVTSDTVRGIPRLLLGLYQRPHPVHSGQGR